MTAQFTGRNGNMLFFTDGDRGVIVDSTFGVVVASGRRSMLEPNATWTDGEFSETDLETANTALATLDSSVSAPTGRLYTIPRGVQNEAKKALNQFNRYERGGTDVSVHTAGILASGGQIPFEKLRHISTYFARHKAEKFTHAWEPVDGTPAAAAITWGMWGGDTGQKWATSILNREGEKALTADGVFLPENTPDTQTNAFLSAHDLAPEEGPEFLARVRMDGSGIDRLYKIDTDSHVYVWDDAHWDDLGHIEGDVYSFDAALDMSEDGEIIDPVGKSHVVIDPSSAMVLGARFKQDPFTPVSIEDIDADEAELVKDALSDMDWELVDQALREPVTAAGADVTPGQYTPDERSQNASSQMRTSDGRFATEGQRVAVGGQGNGTITQVNTSNQTVNVQLDGGGTITVPAKQVASERANEPAASIPGNPVAIPKVDLTGILAEPRTPINFKGAQLPGTLPAMTSRDLHDMLYNWPAYVQSQRSSFKTRNTPGTEPSTVADSYDNPLLATWLQKKKSNSSSTWYEPAFSVKGMTAGAIPPVGTPETPETSDVQPVYLAIVAPDDPTAVTQLISLVPASSTSSSPMTYTRKDGQWERDERTMRDLQSATPPPVIPLDTATLNDCLSQVDDKQAEMAESDTDQPQETAVVDGAPVTPTSGNGGQASTATPAPVAASAMTVDETLMLLWGPREELMQYGLTAAGGVDRNKGQAEELRRYWLHGEGAAKIRWGEPGDWSRCVRHLGKFMGEQAKGYCQLRHEEATGESTSEHAKDASIESFAVDEADAWTPRQEILDIIDNLFSPEAIQAAGGVDRNNGGAEKLRKYWTHGPGAVKIRWGTPGDWTRCYRNLAKYMGERAKGYCALRHEEMDKMWPGDARNLSSRLDGTFSTDELVTRAEFTSRVTTKVRAQMAHDKLRGLVAGATPDGVPVYGEMPIPGDSHGASFIIPTLLPIGEESGDNRIIAEDADVDIRDLPVPLLWQINTASGHDGAVIVGRLDSMQITDGAIRNARGVFDTGVYGQEAERLVRGRFLRGVSADMDNFEAQEVPVFAENEDADDKSVTIAKKQVLVSKTRIMAATLVAKPAFQECQIFLIEDDAYPEEEDSMFHDMEDGLYTEEADPIEAAALVAAGYVAEHIPVAPPKDWFQDPHLDRPTPITVTDDGRVFGHIASWETDHIGMANNIKPPRSRSNYAYFQTGVLRTQDGEDINVGQLTLSGGHASLEFSAREAVKHYDDTASAIADVKAGEDAFGIWVSGGLRPGTTPEQVRAFRASAPSGDWRPIKGRLELVAVCQVNVPGFPVARTLVAGGQPQAIVAAGAATIARLKGDPIAEMQSRLAKLEQFSTAELQAKADPILEKFAQLKQERKNRQQAELASTVMGLAQRVGVDLTTFAATNQEKRQKEDEARKLIQEVDPTAGTPTPTDTDKGGDADPKYTPETQPRNSDGKFRLILARLRDNVGVNGNQEILDKLKKATDVHVGDYKAASLAYGDLFNTLNKIESGAKDPGTRTTLRGASMDLAKAVANLPLPFDDQSQKVRFSDLPPVLREMFNQLVGDVKQEYKDKSGEKLTDVTSFMSGGDFYSQSNVSSQLNHLLHLLTAKK